MENIQSRITAYQLEYDEIQESVPAPNEAIETLASHFSQPLPDELITFYKTIGGIESDEIFTILSPEKLLEKLSDDSYSGYKSTGIIDMIVAFWAMTDKNFRTMNCFLKKKPKK